MSGHISSVTATLAAPAAAAKRVESSSKVSHAPTWISVGGNPSVDVLGKIGLNQFGQIRLVNNRIDAVLGGERRAALPALMPADRARF